MKFTFPLQTVLKVRRHQENEQQKQLATAMRAVAEIEDGMEANARAVRDLAEAPMPESFTTALLEMRYAYLHDLHKRRFDLENDLKKARAEAEKQRLKLVEAHRKTRILENLEHKKRLEFQVEENRQEMKELNETATIRYNRSRS